MPRASDAERCRELRRSIADDPSRIDALRELHALCDGHGNAAEPHVLSPLLAAIDGPALPADGEFHAGVWRAGGLRAAIGPGLDAELAAGLTTLWDAARAIPRFRGSLGAHGVSERDRITRISFGPVAEAYARALRLLELPEASVYVTLANALPPHALPTHPPIVVAGRGVAQPLPALLYGMAHALWLAQPEHVIGGVLAPKDAHDLLEAARLAFAPVAHARSAAALAGTKELVAALWQTVPARSQAPLAQLLRERADALRRRRVAGSCARERRARGAVRLRRARHRAAHASADRARARRRRDRRRAGFHARLRALASVCRDRALPRCPTPSSTPCAAPYRRHGRFQQWSSKQTRSSFPELSLQ